MSDFKVGDRVLVGTRQKDGGFVAQQKGEIIQDAQMLSGGKKFWTVLTSEKRVVPGFADRMILDEVENSKLWKVLA